MERRWNDTWQERFVAIATREVPGKRKLKRVRNLNKRSVVFPFQFSAKSDIVVCYPILSNFRSA
jgi:hypothetical protein